jgi:OmpA-OmpF porin, OOP family
MGVIVAALSLFVSLSAGTAVSADTTTRYRVTFNEQPPYWKWAGPWKSDEFSRWYTPTAMRIQRTPNTFHWSYIAKHNQPETDFTVSTTFTFVDNKNYVGCGLYVQQGEDVLLVRINADSSYFAVRYNTTSHNMVCVLNDPENVYFRKTSFGRPKRNEVAVARKGNKLELVLNGNVFETLLVKNVFPSGQGGSLTVGITTIGNGTVDIENFSYDYFEIPQPQHPSLFAQAKKIFLPSINEGTGNRFGRIAPNGESFYFIRTFEGSSDDVMVSERQPDRSWGTPMRYGKPLNNNEPNNVVAISQDNNMLYLWGRYTSAGQWNGSGLSVTQRVADGWAVPTGVEIENYVNKSVNREECISADRNVMLLTLDDGTSIGGRDLYVSFRGESGNYSKPARIDALSTTSDEGMPWLAPDNRTLYFSSKINSYGDGDIYVSKRLDSTWQHWTKPQNLGPQINTPGWDGYFSLNNAGTEAYMNTTDGIQSGIFQVDIQGGALAKDLLPDPTLLVRGVVVESKTHKPIQASIQYNDLTTNTSYGSAVSEPLAGKYSIVLPAGLGFSFYATAPGYFPISESVSTKSLDVYQEIERNLEMVKIEKGAVVRLNNIFFDINKDVLRSESRFELQRVIELLNQHPAMAIEVAGHTDTDGSATLNNALAEARAKSVADFLRENGVNATRLTARGYGKSKPIAPNTTEMGKQKNRRVEFTILRVE